MAFIIPINDLVVPQFNLIFAGFRSEHRMEYTGDTPIAGDASDLTVNNGRTVTFEAGQELKWHNQNGAGTFPLCDTIVVRMRHKIPANTGADNLLGAIEYSDTHPQSAIGVQVVRQSGAVVAASQITQLNVLARPGLQAVTANEQTPFFTLAIRYRLTGSSTPVDTDEVIIRMPSTAANGTSVYEIDYVMAGHAYEFPEEIGNGITIQPSLNSDSSTSDSGVVFSNISPSTNSRLTVPFPSLNETISIQPNSSGNPNSSRGLLRIFELANTSQPMFIAPRIGPVDSEGRPVSSMDEQLAILGVIENTPSFTAIDGPNWNVSPLTFISL